MLSALSYLYSHILTVIIDGVVAIGCGAAFCFIVGVLIGGIYDIKKTYGSDPNNDETPAVIFGALGAGLVAFIVTIWMINVSDSLGTVISHQICNAVLGIFISWFIYWAYGKSKRNANANSRPAKKHRPF